LPKIAIVPAFGAALVDAYENPLIARYASPEMSRLWGAQRKFSTWRRLWVALAEAEAELGLTAGDGRTPRIRSEQIAELRAHVDDIDFERAALHERRLRHDVMAHIHTYGERCPSARDIIHLGATSCYVTDNTDLILMREGLGVIRDRLVGVIDGLAKVADREKDTVTVGYTHFQPAQFTTVGKRACLWCYDFVLDLEEIEHRLARLRFRSVKGATGTQASFLSLFHGDHEKVRQLDRLIARKMGFDSVYPVTGQTYSRKVDSQVLDALSGLGQSAHKFGNDLRLLSNRQELSEPLEQEQVGSSAMPYKQNPIRAERMCGLARFVNSLAVSAAQTAATQWLERTLDDSVNRRLTLPQAFLATDGELRLALNIIGGLVVNRDVIAAHVAEMLPFVATEELLMEAVVRGGDRQTVHERIRVHSLAASERLKKGGNNDLIDRLHKDPVFAQIDFEALLDPRRFAGRAPQQVDEFITEQVNPIRARYPQLLHQTAKLNV
jgi:adenylosuccinate lyase